MKIKRTISIIAALLALFGAKGQSTEGLSDNQRAVGHDVTDRIDISNAAVGTPGTYSMGASLQASELKNYRGCRVVGVRLAAGCDLGRSRFFLYGITPEGLQEKHSQNQRVYEGWNNVFFNGDGFEITGDEGLFYGFDYTETADMVAADLGGLCGVGEGSSGGFQLLQEGRLYDVTGIGDLCVQLIVDITNLPALNMGFTFVDGGFKYKPAGEGLEIFAMVMNAGRETAGKFGVGWKFGTEAGGTIEVEQSVAPGAQEVWQHIFQAPDQTMGIMAGTLELWIESVNGQELPEELKTKTRVDRWWYEDSMQREKAYLEIYTDQENAAGALMDEVIAGLTDDDFEKVVVTRVPAPGNTLAAGGSEMLHKLYAYTTPCFTVNRSLFPGEAHTAYDLNDYFGMLPPEFLSTIVSDIIYQDYLSPTFCTISLTTEYDEATRELKAEISGELVEGLELGDNKVGVTVMLTEDGVTGRQAYVDGNGRVRYDSDYSYTDLLRGYMTSPEGNEANLVYLDDGSTNAYYGIELQKVLPQEWDATRMNVTALVHMLKAPAEREPGDCDILGCTRKPVAGGSGIGAIKTRNPEGPTRYYDLQGRPLPERPSKGIWIESNEKRMGRGDFRF